MSRSRPGLAVVSSFGRSEVYNCADPQYWSKAHLVRCGVDASFLDAPPTPVPAEFPVIVLFCTWKATPKRM